MSLRERLRRGIKKRVQRDDGGRNVDGRRAARQATRRTAEALANAGSDPSVRATGTTARDQWDRAQEAAMMGPPVDGSMDPGVSSTRMELVARGGQSRESTAPLEDFVTGGSAPQEGQNGRDDQRGGMEDLVLLGGSGDGADETESLIWGGRP